MKQHHRKRCFQQQWLNTTPEQLTGKMRERQTQQMFERTNRTRETKEIQSEDRKVLRTKLTLSLRFYCTDVSWVLILGGDGVCYRLAAGVSRHRGPCEGSAGPESQCGSLWLSAAKSAGVSSPDVIWTSWPSCEHFFCCKGLNPRLFMGIDSLLEPRVDVRGTTVNGDSASASFFSPGCCKKKKYPQVILE